MNPDDLTSQTIFEQSPVSTQIFSPKGETLMANKAWEKLWGIKHDQIKGYNVLKDKQLVIKGIMPLIKQGFKGDTVHIPAIKYEPAQTINVKGAVPYRWVKALAYPVIEGKGKIKYIVLHHEDITDQKTYEEKIEESEVRYKTLTNFAPVGIFQTDADGNCLYVNNWWLKYAGMSMDEARGQGWIRALHPDDKERVFKEWYQAAKKKKEFVSEYRFQNTEGKVTWLYGNAIALKDKRGRVTGYLGSVRNITDNKKTEETLAFQANILKNISDSVITTNLDGKVTFWNKGAEKIFGYKAVEMLGKTLQSIYPKLSKKQTLRDLGEILTGKAYEGEWQGVRKDGKHVWVQIKTTVLLDSKRKPIGLIGVAKDVTSRKATEEALIASEERLRLALDAGNVGVWDWDIVNNHITWSENLYKIHGVPKNKFHGTMEEYKNFIYKEDQEFVLTTINDALENQKPYMLEFRGYGPKRKIIWITTRARVLYDEKQRPIRMLGATIDTTERKVAEKQKDEFIALASHELRTPITSLKAFAQVLERSVFREKDSKSSVLLKKMGVQIDKLIYLVRDLLDVSRIEEGKLVFRYEPFSFNDLIEEIVEEVQRTTDDHKIIIKLHPCPNVNYDKDRFGQVLTNLLTNAIKYSPDKKKVLVKSKIKNGTLALSVKDYGVGIPKDKQKQIFDRFYRVSRDNDTYPGLGLGLYISKEIVERQGGKISVKSSPNKGSTFTFTIPLKRS